MEGKTMFRPPTWSSRDWCMPCMAKTGMNHRRPANCDRPTSTITSIILAKKAMTVPHLQDSTDNELPESHTENERMKLVTPCGNTVVAIEVCASAEKYDTMACNILMAAKQHLEKHEDSKVIVLIIGTSQSERIAIEIASKIPVYSKDQVNIFMADSSIERLMAAQNVCNDVIYWPPDEDEPSLVEKTKCTCKGGVDLILDFEGSTRTIKRAIQLLNKGGELLIGTDTFTKSSSSLYTLIAQQESTTSVPENKKINETITSDDFQLHGIMSYDPFEV